MKVCTKCKEEKELSEFYKENRYSSGYRSQCKICQDEKRREYEKNNPVVVFEIRKRYRDKNKCKNPVTDKNYYLKNKYKIRKQQAEYRKNNREKIREINRNWQKKKTRTDPLFLMKKTLRMRLYNIFKSKRYKKNNKTDHLLCANYKIVYSHLEKQFYGGMNWNNKGKWEIDHIIPLSSANTKKELIQLCHYSNLQPLWAKDNRVKKNTIPLVSQI